MHESSQRLELPGKPGPFKCPQHSELLKYTIAQSRDGKVWCPMRRVWVCGAAVLGLVFGYAMPARAAGFDLAAGRSAAGPAAGSGIGDATVAFLTVAPTIGDDDKVGFAPIGTLGWVGSHHTSQGHLDRSVFLAAGGLRYRFFRRFFVSEQIAVTSVRTSALSSRFEFMTTLGVQVGHVMLMARHISNAHLIGGGPNHGETMLLIGVKL